MSSATATVRSGGLFWLKRVTMLFMRCIAVLVEWLPMKLCCVDICGILFVMYDSSVFSNVLLSPREVKWVCMMCLCSCLCWFLELVYNSEIEGSHAFCVLMLFLCFILCPMWSGSTLNVVCILSFEMLCLSA